MENSMNKELLEFFNKQINHEFCLSYFYFALSIYFDKIAMNGFSKYMKHRASVNLLCAQSIYDYLILRNEKFVFLYIEKPDIKWKNISGIFSLILDNEKFICEKIRKICDFANEINDKGALEFAFKILQNKEKNLIMTKKLVLKMKSSTYDFAAISRY